MSITSWEHMVPIVAEGTSLRGPRRLLLGKSVSNNWAVHFTALCALQSILAVLLFLWPMVQERTSYLTEDLGAPAVSRLKSLHFQLVFLRLSTEQRYSHLVTHLQGQGS